MPLITCHSLLTPFLLAGINEAEGNPGLGERQGEQAFVGAAGLKNDEGPRGT